jgi:hypothetical protein
VGKAKSLGREVGIPNKWESRRAETSPLKSACGTVNEAKVSFGMIGGSILHTIVLVQSSAAVWRCPV